MTHDELLAEIDSAELGWYYGWMKDSLCAVVELHKPIKERGGYFTCSCCVGIITNDGGYTHTKYPCPTIQAIEKHLS